MFRELLKEAQKVFPSPKINESSADDAVFNVLDTYNDHAGGDQILNFAMEEFGWDEEEALIELVKFYEEYGDPRTADEIRNQ